MKDSWKLKDVWKCLSCETLNDNAASSCAGCKRSRTKQRLDQWRMPLMVALFLLPLWLPFPYLGLLFIEMKITPNGPVNQLAFFTLWATPAIGALPIILGRTMSWIEKLLIVPIYYILGLLATGVIGWIVGYWWRIIDGY